MKEAYQQAVIQSESCANIYKPDEKIESCDTKSLKERFEKGELFTEKEQKAEDEENEVYQSGKFFLENHLTHLSFFCVCL